eukprot:TRINITY_DN19517_c0_g1_i1.p1 TRINITY_DN19517_c0_g1~~TRINITY_DN19517_c0_g1_i1.p1  ORF type:complete len:169 (+),score=15.44 TRINITY_DN19517_c0_g1_i1:111-617(+)
MAMSSSAPSAHIYIDRPCLLPGETLSGTVILRAPLDTAFKGIGLRFIGEECANFIDSGEVYSDALKFLDVKVTLYGTPGSSEGPDLLLRQGEWKYPFSVPISYSLPPSLQLARVSGIEYRVEVVVTFSARPRLRVSEPFYLGAVAVGGGGGWGGAPMRVTSTGRRRWG